MATKKGRIYRKRRESFSLSALTLILLIIFVLGAITHVLPQAIFQGNELVNGSGVVKTQFSQTLMAPILGFANSIDICLFILIFGAFIKVVNKTEAIEDGIEVLIKKFKGKELIFIPILMFLFSIGGTTYGMLEETIGFYALLSAFMVMAGMDTLVASSIILLGAGSGVLGSTINPFAIGTAIAALPEGIEVNQGIIFAIGIALWLSTYIISTLFVLSYAKKVKNKKGSILSSHEKKAMKEVYSLKKGEKLTTKLNINQKWTLIFFILTFIIMIIGFIPWKEFGVHIFEITGFVTGSPLGEWGFAQATIWFAIMTILIGFINHMQEQDFIETFIDGADDMVGVVLVIALARGASILMIETHLDNYIIYNTANVLNNTPVIVFAPVNYILHAGLSVLIPSSAALTSLSTPIMAPIANNLGLSVETTIMEMVAANGLANLFAPTCGAIMGGLALAKVEYDTWLKWVWKVIVLIAIVNIFILTIAMLIL